MIALVIRDADTSVIPNRELSVFPRRKKKTDYLVENRNKQLADLSVGLEVLNILLIA